MAYDEDLAERVRRHLADAPDLAERSMFGGLAFMVSGHMACGVSGSDLMLRLGPEGGPRALERPHTRPMDFTGRPMRAYVFVGPQGTRDDSSLRSWVAEAVAFVGTLPPKRSR